MPTRTLGTTRTMRTCVSAALTVAAALLLAPAAPADTSASANWAGYAVHHSGISFRKVSASWKQPHVSCAPGRPTYSAFWVGIGGYSPTAAALEQIGTEADCTYGGTPKLSTWYELVPAPSRTISLPVRAGDTINASVTVVGHRVTMTLNDATRHRGFSKTVQASVVDVSSAEWIVEAPSDCVTIYACQTLPLADFGTAQFRNASVTGAKGHVGTISPAPWNATKIVLMPGGRRFVSYVGYGATGGEATPSPLQAKGSAFTVTYTPLSVGTNPFMTVRAAAPGLSGHLYH